MLGNFRLKALAVSALALPLLALPSVASAADTPIHDRYANDAKLQTLVAQKAKSLLLPADVSAILSSVASTTQGLRVCTTC